MDATLVESQKQEALYSYKKYRAYQPLSTYWSEADLIVHSEFRDGNVPAGHQQLRVLKEALGHLPAGVENVMSRVPGSGVRGRGSGERETTASSLAGKQQAREAVRSQRCMVGHSGAGLQSEFGDEAVGIGWRVGEQAAQGSSLRPDLPSWPGGAACPEAHHPPGQRPSLLRVVAQGAAEDIGADR